MKRKSKDWEEKDYYSSDEDTFLDRTGSVERKRNLRMKQAGKLKEKVETFDSMVIQFLILLDPSIHMNSNSKSLAAR